VGPALEEVVAVEPVVVVLLPEGDATFGPGSSDLIAPARK